MSYPPYTLKQNGTILTLIQTLNQLSDVDDNLNPVGGDFFYFDGNFWTESGPPASVNIYNSDGTITDPLRTVNLNGGTLKIGTGPTYLSIDESTGFLTIRGSDTITVTSDGDIVMSSIANNFKVTDGGSQTFVNVNSSTGGIDFTSPTSINITAQNPTITETGGVLLVNSLSNNIQLNQVPPTLNTETSCLVRASLNGQLSQRFFSSIHPAIISLTICGDGTTSSFNATNANWYEYNGQAGDSTSTTLNTSELPSAKYTLSGTSNRVVWGGNANYLNISVSFIFQGVVAGNYRFAILKNGVTPPSLYYPITVLSASDYAITVSGAFSATTNDFFNLGVYNGTGLSSVMSFKNITFNAVSTELF